MTRPLCLAALLLLPAACAPFLQIAPPGPATAAEPPPLLPLTTLLAQADAG